MWQRPPGAPAPAGRRDDQDARAGHRSAAWRRSAPLEESVTDYARLLSAGDIPRSAPRPVPIFLDPTYGVWMVDDYATPVANCP